MSAITPTNQVTTLANSIIQNFDANRDGSLSSDEFTTFLGQLLGNAATPQPPAGTLQPSAGTPSAPTERSTIFASVSEPATPRTRIGTMVGFDDVKLRDESHDTFKYQIGRILQYFPNTPEGLRQALPEIQKLVPNAKIIGTHGDKIDFGDYRDPKSGVIGIVDVLLAAGEGGRGWAWQPVAATPAAPFAPPVTPAPPTGSSPTNRISSPTPIPGPAPGRANVSSGAAGGAVVSARR